MSAAALAIVGWALALLGAAAVLVLMRERARRLEAVARAAHELRGPLQAIELSVALDGRRNAGGSERRRALELELARARLALDDLQGPPAQGAAPQGAGDPRAPGRLDRLDARRLLEDAARAAAPRAAVAGVQLTYEWSGDDAAVWACELRIAQALGNLLANAIEHGDGPVAIRGRAAGRAVRFEISDHGVGLPAPVADLTRRARAGRGRRGRGLAIAAAIAAAHGGRLAAAPTQSGARLVFELPAGGSTVAPAVGGPSGSPPVRARGRLTNLLDRSE